MLAFFAHGFQIILAIAVSDIRAWSPADHTKIRYCFYVILRTERRNSKKKKKHRHHHHPSNRLKIIVDVLQWWQPRRFFLVLNKKPFSISKFLGPISLFPQPNQWQWQRQRQRRRRLTFLIVSSRPYEKVLLKVKILEWNFKLWVIRSSILYSILWTELLLLLL